ncbi:MAG TPA: hypothetical protein PLT92_03010 [Ignavibacteriaceae bacterium]|jgi:flagellum-specific peptidoglycan hydrolase FlgJ|nr:hypothetical protein [Ignavibacteriaceae bacterium]HOJ17514.1 hypothetical protein [Ignavibacteriaceae bacterium]
MLKAKTVEFFVKYFPLVFTIAKSAKISPYFILSVSALETGYGCSRPGNNFFDSPLLFSTGKNFSKFRI